MRDFVAKVLGHDELSVTLARQIKSPGSHRLILQGKSGTGKSAISEAVARECEASGMYVLVLRGDRGRLDYRYHPLDGLRFRTRATDLVLGGLGTVWEAIGEFRPGTKTLEKAVKVALTASDRYLGAPKSVVGDHVCEAFINGLQRVGKKKDLLLVLDDVQYFDVDSAILLERTIREFSKYPGLAAKLSILVNRNTDHPLPEPGGAILRTFSAPRTIESCPRSRFPELLQAFGLHSLPDAATLDILFDCSGGNLEVVRALSAEMFKDRQLQAANETELFREVLGRTLERALRADDPLLSILSIASIAGTGISRDEVACLTGHSKEDLADAFKRAKDLALVDETASFFRFRHEATWHFFWGKVAAKERDAHARYAKCLTTLRPSSYGEHQTHLLAANLHEEAVIAGAQAILQQARHRPLPLNAHVALMSSWRGHETVSEATSDILSAMDLVRAGRIGDALTILEAISEAAPTALLAERDFVRATAYLKRPSRNAIERALSILTAWDDSLADDHLEVWSRLKSTATFAFVQAAKFDDASKARQILFRKLARPAALDETIKRSILRWELNANMLLEPEAANRQIERATGSLLKLSDEGTTASPADAFIGLTNLSSSELALSRFERASGVAAQAIELKREAGFEIAASRIPALSNLLVSEHLSGRMTPVACAKRFLDTVGQVPDDEDFLLLASNCLASLIDAEDLVEAKRLVQHITGVTIIEDCEDYVRYFWQSNIATLELMQGHPTAAIEIMDAIAECLQSFPPGDRRALTARHKVIADALFEGSVSPQGLNELLRKQPPGGGPTWSFFGRLALYTPIEIWADI